MAQAILPERADAHFTSLAVRGPPPRPDHFPIVGIGASAGGLDACRKLLDVLPPGNGMAFILVQHLDPTHESMMVDLLASHTPMTVRQAADGMPIEPDHLYVIPPGTYLSVVDGSAAAVAARRRVMARACRSISCCTRWPRTAATRAVCVILSGTGADGSSGLKAIKDTRRSGHRAGPRRSRLWRHAAQRDRDGRRGSCAAGGPHSGSAGQPTDRRMTLAAGSRTLRRTGRRTWLPEIIDLLRAKTAHDFTLYKPGTLAAPDRAAHGDGGDQDRQHGAVSRDAAQRSRPNSTCWQRTC